MLMRIVNKKYNSKGKKFKVHRATLESSKHQDESSGILVTDEQQITSTQNHEEEDDVRGTADRITSSIDLQNQPFGTPMDIRFNKGSFAAYNSSLMTAHSVENPHLQ